MKTLHITNAYHGTSGGIRTFYQALLAAANQHRREVVLVAPAARTSTREVGSYGRIEFVAAPRAAAFDRRYRVMLPSQYLAGPRSPLVQVLARERADVVEICDKYSLCYLAAVLRKRWYAAVPRPTLVGLSCERFDDNIAAYVSGAPAANAFTKWYIRNIYGPPFDVHIANSQYTAAELRRALHDRPPGFIRVCPMGVDVDGFDPSLRSDGTREELLWQAGGRAHSVLVLYAGRIAPEKNIELLVDTLRVLVSDGGADFRLVVAGDGPRAPWLRAQARGTLRNRILLLGNVDRAELATIYASCDVFVHPNPREPFGIGPLEAMASGVPVVVPDSGGVLEYASDANAWPARPSADAFACAVRRALAGDPDRIASAATTARSFSWTRITRQFFDLYDELNDQQKSRRGSTTPAAVPTCVA